MNGPDGSLGDHLSAVLAAGLSDGSTRMRVRRAWPRDLDDPRRGYTLEVEHPHDGVVGAVLDASAPGGRLVPDDPRLPRLGRLRGAGLAVLAHRTHKRAVLRAADGTFVKLATPSATARALAALAAVDSRLGSASPARPAFAESGGALLRSFADRGELHLTPVPGRPLSAALATSGRERARGLVEAIAGALTNLAGIRADRESPALPRHSIADEARVLRRWVASAQACAPLSGRERELLEDAAAIATELDRLARRDTALVLAHRDLHEGQILLDTGAPAPTFLPAGRAGERPAVAFLDWDTAAWADPATDPANLLAHLDRAGHDELAAGLETALADAGHPAYLDAASRHRAAVLRRATALRLIAVHAFRPRPPV